MIPTRHPRFRWIVLLYGGGLLLWLSLEDSSVIPVIMAGSGVTMIAAYSLITGRVGGKTLSVRAVLIGAALVGAGIGLGTALCAALLMLFKIGMHAHPFPDYPPGLILDALRRAPMWALAGALAGVGVALLCCDRRSPSA